jgi:hypothetical protein
MEDIATLLDTLNSDDDRSAWRDAYDALLDAGYSWQYSAADDRYRLSDLCAYFGF